MKRDGYILPDCIVIGAQKCGTTAMWQTLAKHSQVGKSSPKEKRFFTGHFEKGLGFYSDMFEDETKVHLDVTPQYLRSGIAAERVKATVPDVKLIVSFRDPVDRAYSNYHHSKRKAEALAPDERFPTFEEMIDEEIATNHRSASLLWTGQYANGLEKWLELFDRDQILVVDWGRFYSDNEAVYREIQAFIGLDYEALDPGGEFNEKDAMAPETRQRLTEYFAPHDRRLAELTGQTFSWMPGAAPLETRKQDYHDNVVSEADRARKTQKFLRKHGHKARPKYAATVSEEG